MNRRSTYDDYDSYDDEDYNGKRKVRRFTTDEKKPALDKKKKWERESPVDDFYDDRR